MKNVIKIGLLLFCMGGCQSEEDFGDTKFLDSTSASADLKLTYVVSDDNKGEVVFTPQGKGVLYYILDFGDQSKVSDKIKPGHTLKHIYKEGTYKSVLKAYNAVGKVTSKTTNVNVAFQSPKNIKTVVETDKVVSKKVNVTVTGDFATHYEVYFGESAKEKPVKADIGKTASYVYAKKGTYNLKIVITGQAKATKTINKTVTAVEILTPLQAAVTPPDRDASQYKSIYSDKYKNTAGVNVFPDWGQAGQGSNWSTHKIGADNIIKYGKLSYQGIEFSNIDISGMSHLHLDIWTPNDNVKIKIFLISKTPKVEKFILKTLTKGTWNSIDIPLSDYTSQGLKLTSIFQFKFEENVRPWAKNDVFIDNIYFYKN